MNLTSVQLVTIITESVLEEQIIEGIKAHGATGYTIVNTHGEGSRHMRAGEIPGQNIKIETLVFSETANRIVNFISSAFFENYGVICYLSEVQVVRGEKFRLK